MSAAFDQFRERNGAQFAAALSTKFRGTVSREQHGTHPHQMRRKLYAENPQTTSALPPVTTQELTKECQHVVLQFRTSDVVEDTQASLRAIENIRNGESGMSLKTFVNLCRSNPRARAMVAPLLGYGDESDPNVVQAISVLLNSLVRSDTPELPTKPIPFDKSEGSGHDDLTPPVVVADLFEGAA